MMDPDIPVENEFSIQGTRRKRRGEIFLFILSVMVILSCSVLNLFLTWSLEQSLFENPQGVPDVRWMIQLVMSLFLIIPLALFYRYNRSPNLKPFFGLWLWGAVVACISTPIRLLSVTAQQMTSLGQMGTLVLAFGLFKLFTGRKQHPVEGSKQGRSDTGLSTVIVALMMLPWALFGALGSWVDALLALLSGVLFGICIADWSHTFFLTAWHNREKDPDIPHFLLDGFALALFMLILLTGLSVNGSQSVMVIALPAIAWLVTGAAVNTRQTNRDGRLAIAILSGSAFCLPLVWFDMDELFLLISSSPGETFEWAVKSALVSLAVIVLAMIVILVLFKPFKGLKLSGRVNQLLVLVSILAVAVVYFAFGQVGWFGEKSFVIFKQQADLTGIDPSSNIVTKRNQVYSLLVESALQSQNVLQSELDAWRIPHTSYYLVNAMEVPGGPVTRAWLRSQPGVARILESPILRPLHVRPPQTKGDLTAASGQPAWNLKMIGVDRVWEEFGVKGKGIVVGQSDSGVDGFHAQLASSYRGRQSGNAYNWLDPWSESEFPVDAGGHGTATLGLIVGKDIGIAPNAQWFACVNLARNLGNPAHYLDCMQFMLAPYPQGGDPFTDGDPAQGAMVMNNSWGCPAVEGCDANVFLPAVNALDTAGIFVSAAAGNTGYYGCSSVTDPLAIYANVLTAGSVNASGMLSAFSSMGPVLVDGSGRVKPDVLAPGEGILSSYPLNTYQVSSGTSFAGPHVAGVVALMWSANPLLIGQTEITRQLIEQTASPLTTTVPACALTGSSPNNAEGYGLINAYEAVKAALAYR